MATKKKPASKPVVEKEPAVEKEAVEIDYRKYIPPKDK